MTKKVILTESELVNLVKKVMREQDETNFEEPEPEIYTIAMSNVGKDSENVGLAEDFDEFDDSEE